MTTSDHVTLSALVDHSAAPWIPDIHADDCENDACQGCEPQHLAEKAATGCACGPQLRCPSGHCARHQLCQDCGNCCSCKCAEVGESRG